MKIVVSLDSFKGSLSSEEANRAVAEGIRRAMPEAEVVTSPLADGGEGTALALTIALGGRMEHITVTGPLGEPVLAEYGWIPERETMVLEMATCAGLPLVPKEKRDPMVTTTYGVGEMIAYGIKEKGCRRFLVGIGGSATNDGGVGMLSALGFSFLDREGAPIRQGAGGLADLARIDRTGALKALSECDFCIACDVTNPLTGGMGCSAVFAPQKGAAPEDIPRMDAWLAAYGEKTAALFGKDLAQSPGAGAAGGLGFAFLAYLGGRLESGVRLVLNETGLREKIQGADLVITGEGRLDGQSCMGKAPIGVADLAAEQNVPVVALAGCLGAQVEGCLTQGIHAYFPILPGPCSLEEAMEGERAYRNLRGTAEQVLRLWGLRKRNE